MIKLTLLYKIVSAPTILKALALKKGSLILLSIPVSIGFVGALKKIVEDVDQKDLVLPIIAIAGCIVLYFTFFAVDFAWGMVASKEESKGNKDWIESNKLYSSIGKIGGVLLIDFVMLSIILFLIVIGFVSVSIGMLVIAVLLNVVAMMYEFHSIGENIKRKTGEKPKYFMLFDRITILLENKIISKIDNNI